MKEVRIQAVVDATKCTGCDTCIHVCPTAAYTPPDRRPIERHMFPPCNAACPIGIDVEGFVTLTQQEEWDEALQLLRNTNPLPGVTGRVCEGFCEQACNRGRFDQSVSIKALERTLADHATQGPPEALASQPERKERVAVIGSGPAGLSCAYHLVRMGFRVTVFEQSPKLGGLLRYGIPSSRLPEEVLDREIEVLYKLGIDFKPNQKYGDNLQKKDLEDYDAVYLTLDSDEAQKIGARTPMPKIFASGDIATDGRSVAHAIGSGLRGARAVAAYLEDESIVEEATEKPVVSASQMNFEYYDPVPGLNSPRIPVEGAVSGFEEIHRTPSAKASASEAERCLHCGVMPEFHPEHCRGCANCSSRCPSYAITVRELESPYVVKVEVEDSILEEANLICRKASFNPNLRVCACTATRAVEVAAAIMKGGKTPEEISRATGIRTGCASGCIVRILCLMKAAGLDFGSSLQPDLWYPTVTTIWDIPRSVIDKYQDRGFRFEEDREFYTKIGRQRPDWS